MLSQENINGVERIKSLEKKGDYSKALEISQLLAKKNNDKSIVT